MYKEIYKRGEYPKYKELIDNFIWKRYDKLVVENTSVHISNLNGLLALVEDIYLPSVQGLIDDINQVDQAINKSDVVKTYASCIQFLHIADEILDFIEWQYRKESDFYSLDYIVDALCEMRGELPNLVMEDNLDNYKGYVLRLIRDTERQLELLQEESEKLLNALKDNDFIERVIREYGK